MEKIFSLVPKMDARDSHLVDMLLERIRAFLAQHGWKEIPLGVSSTGGVLIAVGGDGTVLTAMRHALKRKAEVFGFNIGKIGYLAEFSPEQVESSLDELLVQDQRWMDRRSVLECSGQMAINEFAILPQYSKDTLKYEFFVDGISSGKHHANGLLVSTPTGSTAYAASVGGSILQPDAPVFQISAVAPMSLSAKSIVVADRSRISVKVFGRKGLRYNLVADGWTTVELEPDANGEIILDFQKHAESVTLLHASNWNFFEILQRKLLWNRPI